MCDFRFPIRRNFARGTQFFFVLWFKNSASPTKFRLVESRFKTDIYTVKAFLEKLWQCKPLFYNI